MDSRLIFALLILGFCLQKSCTLPAKTIYKCLEEAPKANQTENFVLFWTIDVPIKFESPIKEVLDDTLKDTLPIMKLALENVYNCAIGKDSIQPNATSNSTSRLVDESAYWNGQLHEVLVGEAKSIWDQFESQDEDKHSELAKCLKGLKAGDKNWLKDTCPDYDYFISPNLTDLEGSCCKDSQNLKCVLGYISGKCDKFINDVYVFKYRVAYTLLEIHHNETSKKDEKYPDKCHALATGSGAIGRNPRGNTSTWTLIYLALLSWAVQSAVGMIEKFGR